MNDLFRDTNSLSLLNKCIAAVIGILVIHGAFHLLERTLPQRFGKADSRYKVRKFVVFTGYLSILLFLTILFEDRLGRLSFALGVAGAGVAVALQDVCMLQRGHLRQAVRRQARRRRHSWRASPAS